MGEISESVEITVKTIGPAPPSRLSVSSPIKVSLFASLLNLKMSKFNSFIHSLRLLLTIRCVIWENWLPPAPLIIYPLRIWGLFFAAKFWTTLKMTTIVMMSISNSVMVVILTFLSLIWTTCRFNLNSEVRFWQHCLSSKLFHKVA